MILSLHVLQTRVGESNPLCGSHLKLMDNTVILSECGNGRRIYKGSRQIVRDIR
jgi:hypothetical protein